MSTASVLALEPLRPLSRGEYHRLARAGAFEGERVELLEGVLVSMSPQGEAHQWSIVHATKYLVRRVGDLADVRVQLALAVGEDSEPEPDFALVKPSAEVVATPRTALLVIEVSESSLRRDREVKAALYARAKVPEYWLVDLAGQQVEVRTRPVRGQYTRLETLGRMDQVTPVALPSVRLELAYLLPPRRR